MHADIDLINSFGIFIFFLFFENWKFDAMFK